MVIKNLNLETVCGITSKLPDNKLVEFAFWGKSNVGKSSLINAMLNRKSLARTSAQPGKTQTINYYNINDAMYFVDLPGYGYAKVSKETKEKWAKMIDKYITKSKMLRVIFLLIDCRHEPSKTDKQMYDYLCMNGFNPIIIATKSDKLSKGQLQKQLKVIRTGLKAVEGTPIIPFSATLKSGRDELWEMIDDYLEFFNNDNEE